MQGRNFTRWLVVLFVSWLWAGPSLAQTSPAITTGVPDKTVVCLGGTESDRTIVVPFTTEGTFGADNIFKVYLSDKSGSFTNQIGLVTTGTTGQLTARIPEDVEIGTQYKIRIGSTSPSIYGSASSATLTVSAPPAAPVVSNVSYCQNEATVPLTATGTSLKWYTAATGGTASATAPTPTSATSGVTSYYVSQSSSGGCESPRAKIDVTIKPAPAAPTVSPASYSYCVGQSATALSATASSGNTLKWYQGDNTTPLAGTPTPSTASPATLTYKVSQVNTEGCESQKVTITVTVSAPPAAPVVSNVSYCQNEATVPLTATGTNLKWYTAATGGTGTASAPTPSSATSGVTSYYVSQSSNGGCGESPRAKIDVTIRQAPAVPVVSKTSYSYCVGQTPTPLSATASSGNTLRWYLGATQVVDPVPNTLSAATLTYQVSQVNSDGCESAKVSINVVVRATPAPVVDNTLKVFCLNDPQSTLSAQGDSLKWYLPNSTISLTAPAPSTATVGTTSYYVSQTKNGCESTERARIDIKVNPRPNAPTVKAVTLCQNVSAEALNATGTNLKWYDAATGGTGSTSAPTPSTTAVGTTSYYVTQTVDGCESATRAKLDFKIDPTPAAPTVTNADINYCHNDTATKVLSATAVSGNTLKWYLPNGSTQAAAPKPSTANVNNQVFEVTQTNSFKCESPKAKITVIVNPLPASPTVTPVEQCQTRQAQNITLAATGTNGNTFRWYTAASGGTGNATAPSVDLTKPDTISHYVSQVTAKGCEGPRAQLRVEIKRLPALPTVQPLIEYCQFVTATPLAATPETGATINWYGTSATGGTASANAPVPSTQEGGTTSYYVSQTLRGCVGDRAEIKVRINTTSKPAVTSPVEYCQNVTASPLAAQGENLKWYREATASESQTNPFTPFTEKVGTYSFYVTQTGSNKCESPKEEIRVRIKPLPSATIGGDKAISLGQSAEILVNFTGDGPWSYVLSNGLSGRTSQNPLRVQVSPQRTTTYLVTEVSNECGKGTPNGSAMVTVLIPTISTGNPTTASLCAGRTFTIPFQASGEFVSTNKFNVQISPDTTDRNFYTIPTVQNGNDAVATVPDSTRGGNYFVRVVGESPQFILRGSVSPVNVTVRPLPTATLTGATTILVGETANLSVALTGDGPWTFTFNNGARDSLITTSVTPHIVSVRPGTTTTYSVAAVSNQCGTGRASGTARVQVDPILGVEPVLNAKWLTVYPSPVQTTCVVDIEASLVAGEAQLRVFDISGRPVLEKKVRATRTEVDFSRLASGIYLIQVENGGRVAVRRIVKQD